MHSKKLSRASLIFIFSLTAKLFAADPQSPEETAAQLANRAKTDPTAMDVVTSLTTEIGPRLDGTEAEKRAAKWAVAKLEKLGFENIHVETFPLENGWIRGIEKAEVISPSPQPLIITALGESVPTPPEGIEAEIALFHTYAEMLAQPTGSLAGKIAVVTQRMVRTQDASGYRTAVAARNSGPKEAARRGAIAFLLRSAGTDSNRLPHTGATHYGTNVTKIPAAALSIPDAEQLERLSANGGVVKIKLVLTPKNLGPVTSQNVIADLKGSEKPEQIVLLGAHLDSWDLGTGAIDDGAGVAIILAAGKLIHDLPTHPKRTIRVVLYGSEETGIFGGEAYAKLHAPELSNYVIVAEPDHGQGPIYRFQTGVSNVEEATIKRIGAALAPLGIVPGDNLSHGSSDVEPLAERKVPAATLEMDGLDYFDLHHTANDTLDKIQPSRIKQSTAAFAVFAYLAAELDGDYRAPAATMQK